jgi:hypothetical protein
VEDPGKKREFVERASELLPYPVKNLLEERRNPNNNFVETESPYDDNKFAPEKNEQLY